MFRPGIESLYSNNGQGATYNAKQLTCVQALDCKAARMHSESVEIIIPGRHDAVAIETLSK